MSSPGTICIEILYIEGTKYRRWTICRWTRLLVASRARSYIQVSRLQWRGAFTSVSELTLNSWCYKQTTSPSARDAMLFTFVPNSASLSLVQNFQHRLWALNWGSRASYIYTPTLASLEWPGDPASLPSGLPTAHCTVLHTCVKLPSLACGKMENVNELRFRWVQARGHISQKING